MCRWRTRWPRCAKRPARAGVALTIAEAAARLVLRGWSPSEGTDRESDPECDEAEAKTVLDGAGPSGCLPGQESPGQRYRAFAPTGFEPIRCPGRTDCSTAGGPRRLIKSAAVDDRLIPHNPCRSSSVKAPEPEPRRIVPWQPGRVLVVRSALPERHRAMVDPAAGAACDRAKCWASPLTTSTSPRAWFTPRPTGQAHCRTAGVRAARGRQDAHRPVARERRAVARASRRAAVSDGCVSAVAIGRRLSAHRIRALLRHRGTAGVTVVDLDP